MKKDTFVKKVFFHEAICHLATVCNFGGRPNITASHAMAVLNETHLYRGTTKARVRQYFQDVQLPISQFRNKEYFHIASLGNPGQVAIPDRPEFTKNIYSRAFAPRLAGDGDDVLKNWLEFAIRMIASLYQLGGKTWVTAEGLAKVISICGFYNDAPAEDVKVVLASMNLPMNFENSKAEFNIQNCQILINNNKESLK